VFIMATFIRWAAGVLLLGCAVVAVGAWQLEARDALIAWDPDEARDHNQPIPVRTVKVEERSLDETIGGTAVTMPAQTAMISIPTSSSSSADWQVKQVASAPGSTVNQGDVLLTFEPGLFEQTVKQRSAYLAQARSALEAYQRLASQRAATAMQVSEAQLEVETAELELALAQRDLQLCTITSPVNGVIEQLDVVPQMRVGGGSTIATVHQLDPIYVQMDYPMERLDSLVVGQEADVTLDAYAQETFTGKVIRIAPVVSTKTRVLPVMLEIPNPDNRIRAGISGFVRVKSHSSKAKTVPAVAVIKKQQKAMVVTVEDNRAKIREVHTGNATKDGQVEILSGLDIGDEVVIFGHDSLNEGDSVNVDWQKWTRREFASVASAQ
jgi:membrane fusion protein, multidrug efflux system